MEKYCSARQATDDDKIRRMLFSCRITKAPLSQQWLRERATLLPDKYNACLVTE